MEVETTLKPLTGRCSCGRNRYTVSIPSSSTETVQVYFDSGHSQRRYHASPLSAWLRIPITWLHSTTHPLHDDENHSNIKRVYSAPNSSEQRRFCGFCGTPLSYWSELPAEAEYISLTLGSLSSNDLRELEEMGALPKEVVAEAEEDKEVVNEMGPQLRETEGLPWFEKLVEGSSLGRIRRTGLRKEGNGRVVEWEIVEWTEGDDSSALGKRKIGDVEEEVGTKIGE